MLESVPSHQLADIMASIVNATFNEKLDILNAVDLKIRFEKALPLLLRQIEGVKLLQEKQELEKREGMLIIAYQNWQNTYRKFKFLAYFIFLYCI